MHECKDEIMFIQGDVVETYFYIEGIEKEYIENLYFSCEAEKILTVLPYSEEQEGYCFRLTSEQTSLLRPKFCTYDLTLELIDGNTMTLLHGRSFIVLKKRNTLNPDDYRDDEDEPIEGGDDNGDEENGGNNEGEGEVGGNEGSEGSGDNGDNNNSGGEDLSSGSEDNGSNENIDIGSEENTNENT